MTNEEQNMRKVPDICLKTGEVLNVEGDIPRLHKINFLARSRDKQLYFLMFGPNPNYGRDGLNMWLQLALRGSGKNSYDSSPVTHQDNELFIGTPSDMQMAEIVKRKRLIKEICEYIYKKDNLTGRIEVYELSRKMEESRANIRKDIEDGWGYPPRCIDYYSSNGKYHRLEVLVEGEHFEVLGEEK